MDSYQNLTCGQSGQKFLTLNVVSNQQQGLVSKNVEFMKGRDIKEDESLFNELYIEPIELEPKKPPDIINKRIIPVNIEEWSTQNKVVRPLVKKSIESPGIRKKPITSPEKVKKKQFIEIDLLYGDVERFLFLLKVCYPQLNDVPESELRDEIEKFLKYLTRSRTN
jgi:hypothetical protein